MNKFLLNFLVSQLAGIATPLLVAFAYGGGLTGGALDYVNHHPVLLFFYPLVQVAAREVLNAIGVSKPGSTSVTANSP